MKIKDIKKDIGEVDLSKAGKKTTRFIKWILLGFVLTVILGSVVSGALFLYEKSKLSNIKIEAEILRVGDERCDFRKPVYVTLTNISEKTIAKTRYDIEVRRVGYSSDIAENELKWPETDKILLPGESASFCLTLDLKYPHDETYEFNPFDAKGASLDGRFEEYAQDYRERNSKAIEEIDLTGIVTSVEYK